MFNTGKAPLNYPGMVWECLHRLSLSWKPVGARVNSKHWGLSECLQKEIAGAPLLGLAEAQLEKAVGNNIWYGRNNIVAARRWIRWVKRFFHFLTSVISCARDDLNFFSLMSAHIMSNLMGPPEKYWQRIPRHTMSLHQPWKGYLCYWVPKLVHRQLLQENYLQKGKWEKRRSFFFPQHNFIKKGRCCQYLFSLLVNPHKGNVSSTPLPAKPPQPPFNQVGCEHTFRF